MLSILRDLKTVSNVVWKTGSNVTLVLFLLIGVAQAQTGSFTGTDVGAVAKTGSDSYNSTTGVYTLSGCGADIWGTADAFHFVYQTIPNSGELTARVVSVQNTNAWAKAGVMVRQSTDAGSMQGMTVVTPGEGVSFQYRTTTGGSSGDVQTTGPVAPYWVRIVKDGSIVTSYQSPDGVSWTLMGFIRLPFTGSVDVGLCVCSHTTGALCKATFDNVTLTNTTTFPGPTPWQDQDIGAVLSTQQGLLHYENNLWTVYGSGSDIWGTADAFHYVYEPLSGDGQIITQVLGQTTNTNSWAKSGVMLRQDLTPGSPQISLFTTPGNGIVLQSRAIENGSSSTQTVATSFTFPAWLKLVRSGNQVFASLSPDGVTWNTVATHVISMTTNAYVGLAVTSHNVNATSMAVFSNVQTGPPMLAAEYVSDTTVNLYWPSLANPADIAEYAIYRNGVQVATSPLMAYEDVQLTPSTSYTYQIKALGASNNVLGTSSTLTVTTAAPLLPVPWQHEDVGAPGAILLGGYSQEDLSTQTFTLVGSGADIWNGSDAFQYAWQSLTGNGQIIARVKTETPTNSWTKAGIMLRGSTSASDLQALLALTPGNGITFQARTTSGANDIDELSVPATGPVWLKLIRQGNLISAFESVDGVSWNNVGADITIPFGNTIDVGLALTSHNADALATASFDNVSITSGTVTDTTTPTAPATLSLVAASDVSDTINWTPGADSVGVTGYQVYRNGQLIDSTPSLTYTDTGLTPSTAYTYTVKSVNFGGISSLPSSPFGVTTAASTLPAPWQHFEIGALALAGSVQTTSSGYILQASGADIWNNADGFGYIAQPFTGNGQIILQVSSLSGPQGWTKAGPMIRATTDPGSPQASLFITPGNGVAFQYRTAQGMNSSTVAGPSLIAPVWLQLSRTGTIITALESADGVTWNKVGQVTIPTLPSTAYFGMAETSHQNGTLATATFLNVAVGAPGTDDPLPAAWQILYFGQTGINPTTPSPAGDGYTLLQEYQLQRNPLDYYQGVAPTIAIVSGNNQTGLVGTVFAKPLVIQVSNGSNQPLNNAPVTFSTSGGQLFSSAPVSGSVGTNALLLQTNSQGQISVWLNPSQVGNLQVATSITTGQTFASPGKTTQGALFAETAKSPAVPFINAFGDTSFLLNAPSTFTDAWGFNDLGQLNLTAGTPAATPTSLGSNYLSIASNGHHTLFLNTNHTVSVVGDNYFGQLGLGNQSNQTTLTALPGLSTVLAVATGEQHSLALLQNGTVMAWGGNSSGQLGIGTNTDSLTPVAVPGLTNIVAIACGRLHSLALDNNGNVFVWGDNRFGQLGTGTYTASNVPVQLSPLTPMASLIAGDFHSVAIDKQGNPWSWGANPSGALGQGTQTDVLTPQQIPALTTVASASAGSEFTLFLQTNGTAYGAGANFRGQLASSSLQASATFTTSPNLTPILLPITNFSQLSAGADHAFGISNSTLYGWGANNAGQIGDGTVIDRTTPVPVVAP